MNLLFGRWFWWILGGFHAVVWALIAFVLLTMSGGVALGSRSLVVSKPAVAIVLWVAVAGPATAVALVLRKMRGRE